jgi:Cu(I)/Ag(I) efflux system membrane protein CusA/SilA
MLKRIIEWSVRNRFLVLLLSAASVAGGIWAIERTPLEALPDLSDVQVIVQADYSEQAPRIVEDQVTYPIAAEMLKVPGARTVRGYSFFGVSFVYVIFADGTDLYWARSRVLEYLSAIAARLPATVSPTLGPDATGLGWVFQYALVDTTGRLNLAELRAIQDWNLRYALTAVPGVSEVATIGGFEKQYQVDVDPVELLAHGVSITQVMNAIQNANNDVGAMVIELSEREYMVRGLGYLQSISDIENVVIGATAGGTPLRVGQVGRVTVGPAVRRGLADLDGRGDAVGGIVVMRFGENALQTIQEVKAKLAEVSRSLPAGVVVRPVYDRSELIESAIETLRGKLIEESLIVAFVCMAFLLHASSALVAIISLPIGILLAFVAMRVVGVGADIMSLGGIAIAIGAMIDAAIVMIENMHKHLEREFGGAHGAVIDTRRLSREQRVRIVLASSREVGPALFFSLLIVTVSFLPVFALEGQEGRLFTPLAFTKTFAMAAASLLSVTLVPVAMSLFVRGRIRAERANPVSRALIAAYRPVIDAVLRNKGPVMVGALTVLILTWIPWKRIGREFMPPLQEGTILYMPTTLPGISIARGREILRIQDSILKSFPEVATVWGKAGRANTATDPAGLDMFETTITLRPESQWRPGMTQDRLIASMDSAVRIPGVTNAWTMPIKGRNDMLATGIRTPVGVKIFGPDLAELERIGKEMEHALRAVPGTRSAFAERAVSGYYLDIGIDRAAAARHGLNVGDIQTVVATAIGGMTITQTVEGRERYGVRVRYPQELRDTPERLAAVLVPVSHGAQGPASSMGGGMSPASRSAMAGGRVPQVPLGQVARINLVAGPMVVRTEDAVPTAWVYVDVAGRDIGSYVDAARRAVESEVTLPPGYRVVWSGQYEYMQRAAQKMRVVVPATLLIIFLLLYLNFRRVSDSLIVMLSLPFALVGGIWFIWALGYDWSVAVAIGFIALAGVAAETGVVMLVYLNHAWRDMRDRGQHSVADLYAAIVEGAVERVRPKIMTVSAIMAGLLPILWGNGAGASVMKRIAAPMVGGMISSTVLTLVVIPAVYALVHGRLLRNVSAEEVPTTATVPASNVMRLTSTAQP